MITRSRARRRYPVAGLLTLAGALVAGPALATPALAAGSTSATDETWLMQAHQANLLEVAAGRDAQRFGEDGGVRDMGDQLVDDHRDLDETISSLARKYDVFLPPLPTEAQRRALDDLQNKEGEAYDAAWVRHEVATHRAMKAANQKVIADGEAGDVVAAAREADVVVDEHLDDLAALSRDLGLGRPASVTGGTGGQAASAAARPVTVLSIAGVLLLSAGAVLAAGRRRAEAAAGGTPGQGGA